MSEAGVAVTTVAGPRSSWWRCIAVAGAVHHGKVVCVTARVTAAAVIAARRAGRVS